MKLNIPIFGNKNSERQKTKLVIAINAVDKIEPGDWDTKLNWPSPLQEKNIELRCDAMAKRFSQSTGVPRNQIAYYSALQYYQIEEVLTAMIRATKDGFIWSSSKYKPKSTLDKVIDADVLEEISRLRRAKKDNQAVISKNPIESILQKLKGALSSEDFSRVSRRYDAVMEKEPKVALLGQTGVGKTTTICALMGVDPEDAINRGLISHVKQGTKSATEYHLKTKEDGKIDVIDLPGYGATIDDDRKYDAIYQEIIPTCDVVVMVVDATNRATAQDELMIKKILTYIEK